MRHGLQGALAAIIAFGLSASAAPAQMMIVGNDEKPGWDAEGKPKLREPGHDSLSIIDMSKPDALRIIATIPLINSIVGPPTNLAITPSGDIALVANTVVPSGDGPDYKLVPDDKLFVIDLKAKPPAVVATVTAGKRPSGLAIAPSGKLALLCNRDDGTISVLSIAGKEVKVTDTVSVGAGADQVTAVAITPDGKRALAAKSAGSDGNADMISVIDLEADPVRVIDHITATDSPEGLAISPKGNLAVSVDARGSNFPKSAWFHNDTGAITVLKIDGKKVTRIGVVPVGTFPEGAAFSADGSYLYVGNFIDQDLSVLKVDGDKITDTGTRFKLPGHPASMRAGPQ